MNNNLSEGFMEMKHVWYKRFFSIFFFGLTLWWISIAARALTEGAENNAFTLIYPFASLFGGLLGIKFARNWGGWKSYFGSSILFFSIGLLAQFFGQASYAWSIYIKGVENPYPSIGDFGYYGSVLLYLIGAFNLSRVLVSKSHKIRLSSVLFIYGIPILMIVFAYLVFLRGYEVGDSQPLTILLDFAYPLTQAIYVAIAISTFLVSRNILGGKMLVPALLLLFSLASQYVSDFMFLFQTRIGTWHVGGLNDYLYFFSYCSMTLALMLVNDVYAEVTAK